ncbi:unnamed protein product [Zymoseptoria tritici ST99CH_1A5]|uniref:Efficient mitochondria targeting-associated protein 19 n=3 Tax=Zymoseptoria tritici TaxID=1047171 RepID=F9XIM4_ZYMTI|nr:uncharacterized protein MYCGRDRAFT_101060 [Zymoseptoria tritici IPO323]EGP85094.1 hypothetical protein MYCGRDRAFT_101060 [Zymoseptoria tritici IPO323]SMQ53564.1 unnamed protein product [Zymoseptoria tritici ST99CH_3D7]SMY27199.1 unnamed protein product [Zymoseptoria tritici ST99CH_1A5]
MPTSIFSRKRDLAYLAFFIIHIPTILCVDIVPFYPDAYTPAFLNDLRSWYIATYNDRLFTHPPAWFDLYLLIEMLYHLPLSIWAIPALLRDDPLVPLHLLVFALEAAITTATCLAEMLSWEDFREEQKVALGWLYGPYLLLAVFMSGDMFLRLSGTLRGVGKAKRA